MKKIFIYVLFFVVTFVYADEATPNTSAPATSATVVVAPDYNDKMEYAKPPQDQAGDLTSSQKATQDANSTLGQTGTNASSSNASTATDAANQPTTNDSQTSTTDGTATIKPPSDNINTQSDLADAYLKAGRRYAKVGKHQKSKSFIKRAQELDPSIDINAPDTDDAKPSK